jgi:hypothetical protein
MVLGLQIVAHRRRRRNGESLTACRGVNARIRLQGLGGPSVITYRGQNLVNGYDVFARSGRYPFILFVLRGETCYDGRCNLPDQAMTGLLWDIAADCFISKELATPRAPGPRLVTLPR